MIQSKTRGRFVRSVFKTVLIALGLAFLLKTLLFQPFRIPSQSMEPNLMQGDVIIVSKYAYGYGKYAASPLPLPLKRSIFARPAKRGDIIVFRLDRQSTYYAKRLVGLPGDHVQMKNGVVLINGQAQTQTLVKINLPYNLQTEGDVYAESFDKTGKPHSIFDAQIGSKSDGTPEYSVPANAYFVLGDNRDRSLDSRFPGRQDSLGMIPANSLIGRAEFILLSVGDGFDIKKPWTWGRLRKHRFLHKLG